LARLTQYRQRDAFLEVALDMDAAMDRARELSTAHTDRLGARAIDVLHVACALMLESEVFLTFDDRQLELAKAGGLQAPDLGAA
jgi:hypothetical protein